MRGRWVPLSMNRRFIGDLMWACADIPTVPVQRRMALAEVVAARAAQPTRLPWPALFTKAFALVAAEVPALRRAYVKLPWPHLCEYPASVASIAVEREYRGEKGVFGSRIRSPETLPLAELGRRIRSLQEVPMEQSRAFRQHLGVMRLPWPVRRLLWWLALNVGCKRARLLGTFSVTVYSGLGADSLHPISPTATTLNYGPIARDGAVDVRLTYDHRVLDGATVARALARLEEVLTGAVLEELRGAPAAQAA